MDSLHQHADARRADWLGAARRGQRRGRHRSDDHRTTDPGRHVQVVLPAGHDRPARVERRKGSRACASTGTSTCSSTRSTRAMSGVTVSARAPPHVEHEARPQRRRDRPRDPDRWRRATAVLRRGDRPRDCVLTLYGVRGNTDLINYASARHARAHRRMGAAVGTSARASRSICAARRTAISSCGSAARSCSSCAVARASIPTSAARAHHRRGPGTSADRRDGADGIVGADGHASRRHAAQDASSRSAARASS